MATIAEVKRFWDARPVNSRHSTAKVGTSRYAKEVLERRYTVEPHIIEFLDAYPGPLLKGMRALDVGCGIGSDSIVMAELGATVTAVDISKESLKIAKANAKVLKPQNDIQFYQANIEELSKTIKPKPYDLVWSFGVIHHTPHPEKAVEEIKKFCDKDTIVKVMLYNKYSWKAFWLWVRDRSFKNSEAQQGSPVTYTYSKKEARELFKDFEILDMKVDFIFPYKVDRYIKYEYIHPWYWFIFKHLQHVLGFHLLLTMKLK